MNDDYLMTCILKGMIEDKQYMTTIATVFDKEYFDDAHMAEIFTVTKNHLHEHKTLPSKDIIINTVPADIKDRVINQFQESEATEFSVSKNYDWLLEETNKYLKDKAIKRAIVESVDLIDDGDNVQQIRGIIESALCKDIKIDLGLDYFEQLSERLKRVFSTTDNRIRTFYPTLDELYNGGFPPYTLNFFIAKVHGHKCVCYDTNITIKSDNKINDIKIGDLYKYIHKGEYIGGTNMPGLQNFINKHGEVEGKKRYDEWRSKISSKGVSKLDLFINKYGEVEGKKRYDKFIELTKLGGMRGKGRGTLEWYINKYGEVEGKKRYDKKCRNIKKGTKGINTLEWYINKYGEVEGKKRYDKKCEKISDPGRMTLEWCINKYGEVEGKKRYDGYIKNQKSSNSLDGYIEKYGEVEGVVKWNTRARNISRRNTKNGYIEKYGEVEGEKRFNNRQKKWVDTMSSKPSEEIERINRAKINNTTGKNGYSKISQELFWLLYNEIREDFTVMFAQLTSNGACDDSGKNHEKYLVLGDRYIFPDFYIVDSNKIIEFDGDYWHNKSVKNDHERDLLIEQNGHSVLHIKESDYKQDCDTTIKKCLDFIYNG